MGGLASPGKLEPKSRHLEGESRPPWYWADARFGVVPSVRHPGSRVRLSGCDDPCTVVVEADVDHASEVDGGDSERQAELVLAYASVADSAVAAAHEPGDGPFHHRPPLAVVVGELAVAPGEAGDHELGVVLADAQDATVFGGGASLAERAVGAADAEGGVPFGRDGDGVPGGAGGGASVVVDDEVVTIEPARH